MTATTYLALQTNDPTVAWVTVFCAGVAMAPVFPTTLAMAADAFPKRHRHGHGHRDHLRLDRPGGQFQDCGAIAGGDDKRLGTALLVLPGFSVLMVVVNLVLRPVLARARR